MISRLRLTTVAALLFATCGSDAFSAFFDPLFRITKIQGPVSVMRPGDAESVPAVEGQAYPYGTRVVVGKAHPKAKEDQMPEAHLVLSSDHQFKLGAGGDLVISHGEGGDAEKKVMGSPTAAPDVHHHQQGENAAASRMSVEAKHHALTVKTPLGVVCSSDGAQEISVATTAGCGGLRLRRQPHGWRARV